MTQSPKPSIFDEVSVSGTDAILERPSPTNVVLARDYHAAIAVALFLAVVFAVIYLLYRCTDGGCRIFG